MREWVLLLAQDDAALESAPLRDALASAEWVPTAAGGRARPAALCDPRLSAVAAALRCADDALTHLPAPELSDAPALALARAGMPEATLATLVAAEEAVDARGLVEHGAGLEELLAARAAHIAPPGSGLDAALLARLARCAIYPAPDACGARVRLCPAACCRRSTCSARSGCAPPAWRTSWRCSSRRCANLPEGLDVELAAERALALLAAPQRWEGIGADERAQLAHAAWLPSGALAGEFLAPISFVVQPLRSCSFAPLLRSCPAERRALGFGALAAFTFVTVVYDSAVLPSSHLRNRHGTSAQRRSARPSPQ